jgi:ribonuclease BN (tRNA processing enzyme)
MGGRRDNGPVPVVDGSGVTVTFAGSGDAFGSGGRYQACIHLQGPGGVPPLLLECGATSLPALKRCGLDPAQVGTVVVSHLHGDHFGGLPFLILDGQFSRRTRPLTVAGPAGLARRLTQAMECMFPGSTSVARRFPLEVTELEAGDWVTVGGVQARAWEVEHPSGAAALAVRLRLGGKVIAYTGDTAWTDALAEVADGADLLIAEAYHWDKAVPWHLSHADLAAHCGQLTSARILLTHMSVDMLAHQDEAAFATAYDGLVVKI